MHGQHTTLVCSCCRFILLASLLLLTACSSVQSSPPSPGKTASNPLLNTAWQLRSIQSKNDEQPNVTVEQPERYTLHFLADGRLALQLDCNRGTGSWQTSPAASGTSADSGQLSFGPIATPRMFCPQPSLESRVGRDMGIVRSYLLRDGHLFLSLMADGGIYEWQPLPADQSPENSSRPQP